MAEYRNYIQRYAMLFGAYLGVYWIIGAVIFPLGLANPLLFLLFIAFVIGGPFVGYYYVKTYRKQACGGYISFSHAWFFSMLMYVFAALLAAAAHYIYFRFIDGGYIINTYTSLINDFFSQNTTAADMTPYKEQMEQALEQLSKFTPIDITMQIFSNNIFWGILLAIPTALFAMKKNNGANPIQS